MDNALPSGINSAEYLNYAGGIMNPENNIHFTNGTAGRGLKILGEDYQVTAEVYLDENTLPFIAMRFEGDIRITTYEPQLIIGTVPNGDCFVINRKTPTDRSHSSLEVNFPLPHEVRPFRAIHKLSTARACP